MLLASLVFLAVGPVSTVWGQNFPRRNVVLFVADGLRHEAVDPQITPTIAELRAGGVDFVNSHSIFPTITTPNASVIATGHYLGDTGNFGNEMFLGYPAIANHGWVAIHAVENNAVIPDLCRTSPATTPASPPPMSAP